MDSITPGQEELMAAVSMEWESDALNGGTEYDEGKIKAWVNWLYEYCLLERPVKITVVGSYESADRELDKGEANDDLNQEVGKRILETVRVKIYYGCMAKIDALANPMLRNRAMNELWEGLMLKTDFEKTQENPWGRINKPLRLRNRLHCQFGFSTDHWCAVFDYFTRLGLLSHKDFDGYMGFKEARIWDCFFSKNEAVVVTAPRHVLFNAQNRLHSETESAIEWNDGYAEHYISGVYFEKPAFLKLKDRTMSAREAISLENVEQRGIAMHMLGYSEMLRQLGAHVLDREGDYELLECNLNDDDVPARFVKVRCPSTGKETLLRVDPYDEKTETCMGAVAWTFHMERSKYSPEAET